MRVWLVNHYGLPPSEPGGTRHYALARELIGRGHDVTVIASSFNHATGRQMSLPNGRLSACEQFGDVSFLLLRVPSYRSNVGRLWNMLLFAIQLWSGLATRRIKKPDIIVGSTLTLPAAFAAERIARRVGVPFVLEIRDLWPQTLVDMGMPRYHPAVMGFGVIERYLYRNADKIITLLPNASEHIVPKGAKSDITWIPNGVDMKSMPFPHRPSFHDPFVVMYVGTHGLSDALDSVLDAAAILDKKAPQRFCFRLVGDGSKKTELRRRVESESIGNVRFEDQVPRGKVFSILQDADVFIFAAKKTDLYRYGLSPNKLHEYMAAGRPTIFAGESHNNPVAEASAGLTVAPEDPEAIARAVQALALMSDNERWAMGLRARSYAEEHHDFTVLSRRLELVLQSALVSSDEVHSSVPSIEAN